LLKLGKLEDSRKEFLKLCELRPEYPFYWHRLAASETAKAETSAAQVHLRKAIELKPDFLAAITDLLAIQLKAKQFDAALGELDRFSKIPSDEVHKLRGQVYLVKGDTEAAERELRKAIEANPKNYESYILLAQLNLAQNKLSQALAETER